MIHRMLRREKSRRLSWSRVLALGVAEIFGLPSWAEPTGALAANKHVRLVPYVATLLNLAETSVTDQYWSVRGGGRKP